MNDKIKINVTKKLIKMSCPICHKKKFNSIYSWSDIIYKCDECKHVELY